MGYFDNIKAAIKEGEYHLSADKKHLQRYTNGTWVECSKIVERNDDMSAFTSAWEKVLARTISDMLPTGVTEVDYANKIEYTYSKESDTWQSKPLVILGEDVDTLKEVADWVTEQFSPVVQDWATEENSEDDEWVL